MAISYPLKNPVFTASYPAYTVDDWAKSVVNNARQVIEQNHLQRHIVILAWSMAGEIVQKVNQEAAKANIKIDLFISLSATYPVYNFLNKFTEQLQPDQAGLANMKIFEKNFINMLDYQNQLNHHIIIPETVYTSQFLGNCPIQIFGTLIRYKNGSFVRNLMEVVSDTGALEINSYPPVAVIHGDKDLDATVFNQADWGSIIMRQYYFKMVPLDRKTALKIGGCSNDICLRKVELIKNIPGLLVETVRGSHFFFVGKYGAQNTADKIVLLLKRHADFDKKIIDK